MYAPSAILVGLGLLVAAFPQGIALAASLRCPGAVVGVKPDQTIPPVHAFLKRIASTRCGGT
jgi:hypothetical protein